MIKFIKENIIFFVSAIVVMGLVWNSFGLGEKQSKIIVDPVSPIVLNESSQISSSTINIASTSTPIKSQVITAKRIPTKVQTFIPKTRFINSERNEEGEDDR